MSEPLVKQVAAAINATSYGDGFIEEAREVLLVVAAWLSAQMGPSADWVASALEYEADVPVEKISEEENERRFQECMRIINNMKPGEIEKLMGKEFMEEFRRVSQ